MAIVIIIIDIAPFPPIMFKSALRGLIYKHSFLAPNILMLGDCDCETTK